MDQKLAVATECAAVFCALAYVLLAVKRKRSCWILAGISSLLYIPVFYGVKLYTESVLQLFFIAIAILGWMRWKQGNDGAVPVKQLKLREHLVIIIIYLSLAMISGSLLDRFTDASFPFIDSAITLFSIAASFLQTRRVIENWIYWIAIDSVAAAVYLAKDLYLTSGLYLLYWVLACLGLRQWYIAGRRPAAQP